jgi:hypothetical protein
MFILLKRNSHNFRSHPGVKEFLKSEENTTEHSRFFISTRFVTSGDEFHKGMKEKDKNKSKRRRLQEGSSDSFKGKNGVLDTK